MLEVNNASKQAFSQKGQILRLNEDRAVSSKLSASCFHLPTKKETYEKNMAEGRSRHEYIG